MIRETVTAYGIGWAVTRFIKWMLILAWPMGIIMVFSEMCGGNPDKWSEGTKTTLTIITLCISVPAYLLYRRGTRPQD